MSQFMDPDEINRGYRGSSQESRESDDYLYSELPGQKLRRDEHGTEAMYCRGDPRGRPCEAVPVVALMSLPTPCPPTPNSCWNRSLVTS
jgi:hypothetical protein